LEVGKHVKFSRHVILIGAVMTALVVTMTAAAPASALTKHTVQQTIQNKTGAAAAQVTAPQTAGGITIGTARNAAATYAQTSGKTTRVIAAINDASQSNVAFPVTVPTGSRLAAQPDGSLAVLQDLTGPSSAPGTQQGTVNVLGKISAPWAVDAAGKNLPTTYTYAAGVLTQKVDTAGAVFPVAADPSLAIGFYIVPVFYIAYSRYETFQLYNALGSFASADNLMCSAVPTVFGRNLCTQLLSHFYGPLRTQLTYAVYTLHRCFKQRVPMAPGYWQFVVTYYYTVYC
jgi:hypothetical protein